jgi:p-hydroxybenzoate 3-monooxygenase
VRFSWWMTDLLHNFDDTKDEFDKKMETSEIEYFLKSEAGRKIIAEQYVGLPYEDLK